MHGAAELTATPEGGRNMSNNQTKPNSKGFLAWEAPRFAVPNVGTDDVKVVPVAELPDETLNEMATNWLSDLYRNAGKASPFRLDS